MGQLNCIVFLISAGVAAADFTTCFKSGKYRTIESSELWVDEYKVPFLKFRHFSTRKQKVLEEIVNADTGAPCSPRHLKKKHFMEGIKRGLGAHHASSKQLTESAATACVKLCKVSTYINICDSSNVTFQLVQSVINDLKVIYPFFVVEQ